MAGPGTGISSTCPDDERSLQLLRQCPRHLSFGAGVLGVLLGGLRMGASV